MSQTRTYPLTFTPGQMQPLPGGRFLFILSATAALDLTIRDANGVPSVILGVGAGARMRRQHGEAWRYTEISSASAQSVVVILSDDAEFDVASAVTVAGAVNTVPVAASSIADTVDTPLASGAQSVVPLNAARRFIRIGVPSSGLNSVRVSVAGGANRGQEIQPGMYEDFPTTAALIVRNNNDFGTAAATSYYAEEFA
jgi:hypothetical protein